MEDQITAKLKDAAEKINANDLQGALQAIQEATAMSQDASAKLDTLAAGTGSLSTNITELTGMMSSLEAGASATAGGLVSVKHPEGSFPSNTVSRHCRMALNRPAPASMLFQNGPLCWSPALLLCPKRRAGSIQVCRHCPAVSLPW